MDKKKLRQYRSLKREQKMLEDKMEKLNERAERIPTVAGTVKGSMNTFPYIETHMRVVMSEPKQTDVIYRQMMINGKRQEQVEEERILEREKRMQQVMLQIKKKYGKNAILKGMNRLDTSSMRQSVKI